MTTTANTLSTALAALPLFGGTAPNHQSGITMASDVLVSRTNDGVDINLLWAELRDAIDLINREKLSLVNLLSYWHTNTADLVPQGISSGDFEEATELGVPCPPLKP